MPLTTEEEIDLAEEVRNSLRCATKRIPIITKVKSCEIVGEKLLLLSDLRTGILKKDVLIIRKRFNKARNKIKTSKRSGGSTQDTNEAIGDVSGYEYLSWLVPFINLRKTKSIVDENKADFEFDETRTLVIQDMDEEDNLDDDFYKSDELNLPTPLAGISSEPNNGTPKFIHPRAAARGTGTVLMFLHNHPANLWFIL